MEAGQDAAPAGVAYASCTPGRSPEQPPPATKGWPWAGHRCERESGKSRVARRLARTTKFSACSARHIPRIGGMEKETGPPHPSQTGDRQSVGFFRFCVGLFDVALFDNRIGETSARDR